MNTRRQDAAVVYWLVGNLFALVTIPLALWIARDGRQGVEDFQTLIGVLVALAAATIAYRSMQNQRRIADRALADTQQAREDARLRKQLASRATLPDALEAVCDSASSSAQTLVRLWRQRSDLDHATIEEIANTLSIDISEKQVAAIKDCVEFAPENVSHGLVELLSDAQVHNSRMRSLRAGLRADGERFHVNAHYVAENVVMALTLYVHASKLFAYARREDDDFEKSISRAEIESAANICRINRAHLPILEDVIRRRYAETP